MICLANERQFCERMQFHFYDCPCHVSYSVSPRFIKFYIHFNYATLDVFTCLEELDEAMPDFELENLGWSKFYVSQSDLENPIDGFTKEWKFISFNSDRITE